MARNTLSRTMHDVGLAAWFGGTLANAVALNAAEPGGETDVVQRAGQGVARHFGLLGRGWGTPSLPRPPEVMPVARNPWTGGQVP
jgi:hypothetical protein